MREKEINQILIDILKRNQIYLKSQKNTASCSVIKKKKADDTANIRLICTRS